MSAGSDEAQGAPARAWAAVAAAAVAGFCVVTSEMLPVGVLGGLADDLGVSEGTAGWTVAAPCFAAAVAAIVVVVGAGRLDRRRLLCGLVGALALANVASALAPNLSALLVARVGVGVVVGGFWAIAAWLPGRLVGPRMAARATAFVFGGVSAALVLGVPLGAALGEALGWRGSFAALAGLCLIALLALVVWLPPLPAQSPIRLSAFRALLADAAPRAGLAMTFLVVAGHYAAYTYVTVILAEQGGVGRALMGPLLLVYGLAGLAGNFAAGWAAGRAPLAVLPGAAAALSVIVGLAPSVVAAPASAALTLAVWGFVYGGVPVAIQMWMAFSAPDRGEAGSAAWVSVASAAIGLGAYAGGLTIDRFGTAAVMWAAAATMLAAALLAAARAASSGRASRRPACKRITDGR